MPDLAQYRQHIDSFDVSHLSEYLSPNVNEIDNGHSPSFFLPDELNNYIKNNKGCGDKAFSCIHMNCRSIVKNIDSITSLLDTLNTQFCAIGTSETWLKFDDPFCKTCIVGYDFVGNSREARRGGGVGIFIRQDLDFIHRKELDINTDFLESIFVEIRSFHKNIIVGTVYRPPGQSIQLFQESLSLLLQTINSENKQVYLMKMLIY